MLNVYRSFHLQLEIYWTEQFTKLASKRAFSSWFNADLSQWFSLCWFNLIPSLGREPYYRFNLLFWVLDGPMFQSFSKNTLFQTLL